MSAQNPLTEIRFRIPFDQIEPAHVEPAIDFLLGEARQRLDELASDQGPRTFANTLLALEQVTEKLGFALGVVGHLESVRTTPELRKAYNAVQPKASEFFSSIPLNEAVWKQLQSYAATDEAKALEGVRARFLDKTLSDFRRSGAELDPAGKKRLQEIEVELTKLTTKFSENVLDATNAFELILDDEARLSGLPPSAREQARDSAKSKGKEGWRFTLQAPSYTAVMTYLDDHKVREQVWREYNTRAAKGDFDNRENIAKILELRREKARLLGYDNFADLVLEERMAKTGKRAQEFSEDLRERTKAAFDRENKDLRDFRMAIEGAAAVHMEPWDLAYYAEQLRKEEYDFDEEDLKPYFAYEEVKKGLFAVAKRLFGVDVRPVEGGAPVWHEDVQYYGVFDEDGSQLGAFYADYFPREDKRGGAWMDSFLTGRKKDDGTWEPHLGLMCGNLNPPTEGKPALLSHRDVETLFHEFGHLLHHLLTRVEIRSLAGTNVAWDFVELPSQIMENWCWERQALDLFARHYETGETIPDELFDKMQRARTFRAANAQMRQLSFGSLDLALHIDYDPAKDGDVMKYAYKIAREYSAVPLPREYAMLAGFSHLFASPVGYGAGYYSYKWAEALDADAFTRFAKAGVFDHDTGRAFRANILSKGDSEDPEKLFRAFMGRDPDPQALLVRLGLAA
ncbi:MAG: M3 family peptidase [Acidobacteria bacterium]|nr:M3 family peptidase [Acidobacteriota bacterium]